MSEPMLLAAMTPFEEWEQRDGTTIHSIVAEYECHLPLNVRTAQRYVIATPTGQDCLVVICQEPTAVDWVDFYSRTCGTPKPDEAREWLAKARAEHAAAGERIEALAAQVDALPGPGVGA